MTNAPCVNYLRFLADFLALAFLLRPFELLFFPTVAIFISPIG